MTHGWSSVRGRARHIIYLFDFPENSYALCGAPVRFTNLDGFRPETRKRLRALEVCDWCQHARRKDKR